MTLLLYILAAIGAVTVLVALVLTVAYLRVPKDVREYYRGPYL